MADKKVVKVGIPVGAKIHIDGKEVGANVEPVTEPVVVEPVAEVDKGELAYSNVLYFPFPFELKVGPLENDGVGYKRKITGVRKG